MTWMHILNPTYLCTKYLRLVACSIRGLGKKWLLGFTLAML
jgi:hypothetical protein